MSRKSFVNAAIMIAALALSMASASANVSLRNGNFFISYVDIFYPGGFEPKIERVYNSKTLYSGIFGFGWGNEYEVYLTVSADGSIVVHEYGGGAENRFVPSAFNKAELDKAVNMIAAAAQKSMAVTSPEALKAYKDKLATNAAFRNQEWESYRHQNKLQARQLPVGTQLHSNRFSYQFVTKVANGYQRNFDNGKVELFNEDGRLVRVSDKNANFIEITYGTDKHIQKVVDNFNRKMFFHFNDRGLLDSIEGENGKKVTYQYNKLGELVFSKDVDGNAYSYKYDSMEHHDMTEIGYSDKTTMQMSYWGADKLESIKSVKDRDGTLTEYTYDVDSSDHNHYSVSVSVKGSDKKQISSSKYEYFIKNKPDGDEWTYKLVQTLDGDRTETVYNECCGLPLIIKHGREETAFEYDAKGHVTKKITPNEITELAYDRNAGKVSRVARYPKQNKNQVTWSEFKYDSKGNLVFAKNSDRKGVQLFYDRNGRIASLMDQSKRVINFKYNENSKPIEISDPQLGTITVSYYNSGEIKKVDSTAGRKVALQVTSAFQNLLDIIRPAGVSLSF